MQQTHTNPAMGLDWEQLQPMIDEAMHALPEADREVILQRYFQRMPFLQIGARHGLTENAARMRAERALDKLRGILAARGVSAPTMALGTVLTAQAVLAAPSAVAGTVVSTSLASAAGVAVSGGWFATVKLPVLLPSVCAVMFLVGVIWQRHALNQLREENTALQRAQHAAVAELPAANQMATTDDRQQDKMELLRLRGEIGRLRRDLAEQQATAESMVAISNVAVQPPSPAGTQVHIKARFVMGTEEALEYFKDNSTGIVPAAELKKLMEHLKKSDQIELLSEQQVTTVSGRQAQVTASEVRTNLSTGVVTECGNTLDVLPAVSSDGHSVMLNLVASKMTDKPVLPDELKDTSLPVFGLSQLTANAMVWDGQTVAMTRRTEGRKLVVLVTPTLIDPAGNRVHPETEP